MTMLDTTDNCLLERCFALVAHKLSRMSINITDLSEVHLLEEGSLQELNVSYTLYW